MRSSLRLVWIAVGLLFLLTPDAVAQTQASLAAALEAQYRAAIVRERRLADERELRLIADAETRMRDARQAMLSAQGDRAVAQRALDAAREDYVRLVGSVDIRDAVLRVEIETFRAEFEGRLPQASPDMIEAYRAFADGDRANAWTALEPLLRARAAARVAAARAMAAQEIGQIARLREIMRVNGEARTADVLALWTQMAELDPNRFYPQFQRARLALVLGDLPLAEAAAAVATANAAAIRADEVAATIAAIEAQIALERGETDLAEARFEESLLLARRYAGSEPDGESRRFLTSALRQLGWLAGVLGDFGKSERCYSEAVSLSREAGDAVDDRIDLMLSLTGLAALRRAQGNRAGAEALLREVIDVGHTLLEASPDSQRINLALAAAYGDVGALARSRGEFAASGAFFDLARQLLQRALDGDPQNTEFRVMLANAQGFVGDVWMEFNEHERAREIYAASLGHAQALVALEPRSARFQDVLATALDRTFDLAVRERRLSEAQTIVEEIVRIRASLASNDPQSMSAQSQELNARLNLADALAQIQDVAAARAIWRQCLLDTEAMRARVRDAVEVRRTHYLCMQRLAVYFPQGETSWPQMVEYMEEMDRDGVLSEIDRTWLEDARAHAARMPRRR